VRSHATVSPPLPAARDGMHPPSLAFFQGQRVESPGEAGYRHGGQHQAVAGYGWLRYNGATADVARLVMPNAPRPKSD
jgi:hypothetical protein